RAGRNQAGEAGDRGGRTGPPVPERGGCGPRRSTRGQVPRAREPMNRSDKEQRKAKGRGGVEEESSRSAPQPIADLDFLRGLIAAVDESGIDSLEVARGGTRIRISKTPGGNAQVSH